MFWLTDAKWDIFKKKLPFYKHKLYIDIIIIENHSIDYCKYYQPSMDTLVI